MDTTPNLFDWLGPLVTIANLLLAFYLGFSEVRKRRADTKNVETNSDTKMMQDIKQASLDLYKELKAENQALRERLERCERCLRRNGNIECSGDDDTPDASDRPITQVQP